MGYTDQVDKVLALSDEYVGQCVKLSFMYLDRCNEEINGFTGHQVAVVLAKNRLTMDEIFKEREKYED